MATAFEFIVLGAGNAAGYVAREFVKRGVAAGQLALIGNEPYAPYERPALSKGFLMGKAKLPGFHTAVGIGGERQDPEWYKTHGVELITGKEIVKVDAKAKLLTAADGSTYEAKKALIIATGSSVIQLTRNPGHDLKGIHYLRDVADGEAMLATMGSAKKCVIVGGGYIGMECAAALNLANIDVTMVFPEKHLMERLFTPELAAFYEAKYQAKGIKMLKGGLCTEFVGEGGKVTGCKLGDGTVLEADMVCVGVGARPNTSLFDGQLDMADRPMGGIKVSPTLETSQPGVYAIGDVCAFPLAKYGRVQRVEHVTHCRQSAKHVVDVLHSEVTDYDYLPHFYSRVFDLSWKFWGEPVGEVAVAGSMEPKLLAAWVKDGRVMGVFLESGADDENDAIKAAAVNQPAVDAAKFAGASVEDAIALLKA